MPFVSMSDSISAWSSTPARLAALAIRPSNTLAPTAVPPARKARRPIAGFEIAFLFMVPERTCSDLISKFLSVRFIKGHLMTFVAQLFQRLGLFFTASVVAGIAVAIVSRLLCRILSHRYHAPGSWLLSWTQGRLLPVCVVEPLSFRVQCR